MCINIRQAGEQIRERARARDSASLDAAARIYKYIKHFASYTDASINLRDISIDPREMTDGIAPVAATVAAAAFQYTRIYRYKVLHFSDYQIFLRDIRRYIFDYL